MPTRLGFPVVVAACLLLAGCASEAVPGAMVPPLTPQTLITENSRLRQAVALGEVSGGRETDPLWKSDVSATAFAEALRQALATHALLARANQAFRLDAQLLDLRQPLFGASMTVDARARYRLVRIADNSAVLETEIAHPFTASFASSMLGVERLRLANEGAIRENIRRFFEALIAAEARDPNAFRGLVGS